MAARTIDSEWDVSEAERRRQLHAVCLRDMADLAGLGDRPLGQLGIRFALGPRVRQFARDVARFDRSIHDVGLPAAARELARRYGTEIAASGTARVPADGPLLLVANHPGLSDALAVYATAGRPDLLALARPQPLLRLLPNMRRHVLPVRDGGPSRAGATRATLRHLAYGGALLLFAAGELEPEPSLLPRGGEPLARWGPGVGTLVRLAVRRGIPLRVVPTAISGVSAEPIWRRFGPLLRVRRGSRSRADLAAILQLAFPRLGPTTACVRYGEPLDAAALAANGARDADLTERIRDALRRELTADDRRRGQGARRTLPGCRSRPGSRPG